MSGAGDLRSELVRMFRSNFPRMWRRFRRYRDQHRFAQWEREGQPVPPPHVVKQEMVIGFIQQFGFQAFVETGTYRGEMIDAVRNYVPRLYSIEFDNEYYNAARRAFVSFDNVNLVHGDSGEVLRDLAPRLPERCLFWLDAHAIPGIVESSPVMTPVTRELDAILARRAPDDVILVDDARLLTGTEGWPSLEEIRQRVLAAQPEWGCRVQNDVFVAHRTR